MDRPKNPILRSNGLYFSSISYVKVGFFTLQRIYLDLVEVRNYRVVQSRIRRWIAIFVWLTEENRNTVISAYILKSNLKMCHLVTMQRDFFLLSVDFQASIISRDRSKEFLFKSMQCIRRPLLRCTLVWIFFSESKSDQTTHKQSHLMKQ